MRLKDLAVMFLINLAASFPAKLLRIPKIYNALITSKEKILPSEAYPASTGPIFQPIGLAGGTVFIQPEIIIDGPKPEDYDVHDGDDVKIPFESMRKSKYPEPLTFFPRYNVYYPSHLIIQHPFIYTTIEDPDSGRRIRTKSSNRQPHVDPELENEERKDLSYQKSKMKFKSSSPPPISREYVKNNRPADRSIPDIQPPPPPIRYRDVESEDAR